MPAGEYKVEFSGNECSPERRECAHDSVLQYCSEGLVADALNELREKNLLAAGLELMQSTVAGVSRREVIVRGARYGAAAAVCR